MSSKRKLRRALAEIEQQRADAMNGWQATYDAYLESQRRVAELDEENDALCANVQRLRNELARANNNITAAYENNPMGYSL